MDLASLSQQAFGHFQAGRFHDAEKCCRLILAENAEHAEAWHLLGMIAQEANHPWDAIDFLRRALALDSSRPAYFNNLGIIYKTLDELEQARVQFQAALQLQPGYAPALNNLADVYKDLGAIREAIDYYRKALAANPDSPVIHSNLLYTLQFDPGLSRAVLAAEHCRYGERFGAPIGQRRRHANQADPERPLRIGYVSPHFGNPSMTFFAPILRHHDRACFQLFLYSNLLHPEPILRRVQAQADRWHSVMHQSAEEAARQIEADQIDILVDLSGHMARNRLDIFALKPAPVQLTYLDYPHSTGLPTIDYRLTDAVVEPEDWPVLCPEKPYRLPGCLLCFEPAEAAPAITPLPATQRGFVTFGAPHQIFKLNDGLLRLYGKVLHALPTARLSFIRSSLTPAQIELLRRRAGAVGMPVDRLDFVRPGPREDYLRCTADIDIMLDSDPYSGHTTTCEYLWMGVPVVTLLGDRPAGRISASVLQQLGLGDLVAKTPDEFVGISCKLAADIPLLADLRAGLRELTQMTLADGATFTRGLEEAYREMWRAWCRSHTETTASITPRFSEPLVASPAPALSAPGTLNDQAVALARMGRYGEAESLLRRDVHLRPDQANVYGNLGHLLTLRGQLDEAESAFMHAIRLDPVCADWHRRLGVVLRQRGRLKEAVVSLQHADRFQPDHAETLHALGLTNQALGHKEIALANFRRAADVAGNDLGLLNDLGVHLCQLGQVEEGHVCFHSALKIDPSFGPALANRAYFLADEGQTDEARSHYERAVKSQPGPMLQLALGTLLPVVYESMEQLEESRACMEKRLRRLEADGVRLDPTKQTMPTLFYLAYQGRNDRELASAFARLTVRPRPFQEPRRRSGQRPRIRLGILSHNLHNHTIGLLNHGLIANLDRRQFEVIVLPTVQTGDALEQIILRSAERVVMVPNDLGAALPTVSDLELDILYYPDLGMDPFTWTMAHSRLAPVQCVTWGHPATTGIPTIDYFLSSAHLEVEGSEDQYTEKLIRLPRLGVVYQRPETNVKLGDRSALGLSATAHLYGCPQSLFKIHPEFDAILAGILRQDAAGQIVLLEGRSRSWTELLRRRLRRTLPDVVDRIVFVPRQSRPGFLNLTACSDVLLDPIHFGGGNTTYEALALGIPVVTLPSQFLRCRLSYAIYQQMGVPDLIAEDADSYVRLAVQLGTDADYHADITKRIREKCGVLFDDVGIVRELEKFFVSVAQG